MVSNQTMVKTRPQEDRESLQKFYGVCVTPEWDTVTLVIRAPSEAEASERLHSGYRILMVMELRNEQEQAQERVRIRPSLISTASYL